MRKVILMLLLAVVSGNVMAEWVAIGKSDDDGMTIYANPSTIRKNGNIVKMWTLNDFTTMQTYAGYSYMAVRSQGEFNCKDELYRILATTYHSKNMAGGDVVRSDFIPNAWSGVPPESIAEALWAIACSKK